MPRFRLLLLRPYARLGKESPGADFLARVDYFKSKGLASEPTPFDGRSDYGPFIAQGIPAGGLFSGAEGIKTERQAAIYGGTAGAAYDACYQQLCDDIDNLNLKGFDELADGAAHTTYTFAMTPYENGAGNPVRHGRGHQARSSSAKVSR